MQDFSSKTLSLSHTHVYIQFSSYIQETHIAFETVFLLFFRATCNSIRSRVAIRFGRELEPAGESPSFFGVQTTAK